MIKSKRKGNLFFIIVGVILMIYIISLIIPFMWMVMSSFKSGIEFSKNPFGLPKKWRFDNYSTIISLIKYDGITLSGVPKTYGLGTMVLNSFILSTGISLFSTLVPAITAYIVSKYNFILKKAIYATAIITMIIPIVGNLPSSLYIRGSLNILNNPILYILTCAQPFGFNFLLFYGMFKGISWNYAESVFIDGGGHFTVMFKIMFPLALPTLATVYILAFIGIWNDYQTVLTYLPKFPNLALGMFVFKEKATINPKVVKPHILAGLLISAIPSAVLYLASQNLILSKFAIGGLKE